MTSIKSIVAIVAIVGAAMGASVAAQVAPSAQTTASTAQTTTMTAATGPIHVKYGAPAHAEVLGTTFVDWDALAVRTTANGEQRAVFDNPTGTLEKFEVHVSTLNPGMMSHPPHEHPWEEILVIKDGEVDATINGVKHHAGPGALVFFASHDVHNAQNNGTTPATYYVINFVTDLVHTVADKPAAEQAVAGMLPSSVIDCNSMPAVATATGSRASVVDSPTLTFARFESHITTLNVGASTMPDIVDPGDELFIVKAGTIEARINGVAARINAGSFFYCAPNDKRTFRNIGAVPAVYQVIKVMSDKSPK
ncbi:MAG: cupin domain-containing protein [Candidatus Acidiferrales bacterium]|jgi:quercetin dioxygenase-like cupin family protein